MVINMNEPTITRRRLMAGIGASGLLKQSLHAQASGEKVFRYTFNQETHGWLPGLSDYVLEATRLGFLAEVRQLPPNFQTELRAYYLQSDNTPDDLFMFLKKELTILDGIEPDSTYNVSIHVGFLSNAPTGGPGIGGAPGTNVFLKAGVSLLEPVAILDAAQSYVGLNLDKGSQSESGRDLQVVSNIENGQPPQGDPTYVYLERVHHFPTLVHTDRRGALWITVGTESGYEGRTGIYYYEIIVTLRPL
jgi:hypothetical protein